MSNTIISFHKTKKEAHKTKPQTSATRGISPKALNVYTPERDTKQDRVHDTLLRPIPAGLP